MTAAETGHLVFSTIHTINAGQSISRIVGMFESEEEAQIRQRLSEILRYVVSQRLVSRIGGGRHLLLEVMGSNLRTREAILLGESEASNFLDIIEDSTTFGWMTFDRSIIRAYESGKISEETAELYANRKGVVSQQIDLVKKTRGGMEAPSGLKLDVASTTRRI
jgi:twitching motility protein PilT